MRQSFTRNVSGLCANASSIDDLLLLFVCSMRVECNTCRVSDLSATVHFVISVTEDGVCSRVWVVKVVRVYAKLLLSSSTLSLLFLYEHLVAASFTKDITNIRHCLLCFLISVIKTNIFAKHVLSRLNVQTMLVLDFVVML